MKRIDFAVLTVFIALAFSRGAHAQEPVNVEVSPIGEIEEYKPGVMTKDSVRKVETIPEALSGADYSRLADGEWLDPKDGMYCEKSRELCVAVLCGSTHREHVNSDCWTECTGRMYQECLAIAE